MYLYITCQTDIGYTVTTLSNFSPALTAFHDKLLKGVAMYIQSTINWGIQFFSSKTPNHPDFIPFEWYDLKNNTSVSFDLNITEPLIIGFFDKAHTNDLCKRCSTTGLIYTFYGRAIIYK